MASPVLPLRHSLRQAFIQFPYAPCRTVLAPSAFYADPLHVKRTCQSRRTIYRYAKVAPSATRDRLPPAITETLDESIGCLRAQLVDEQGNIQPPRAMRDLLNLLDRANEHLRKVDDGENGVPVVKVYTKDALLQAARAKEVLAKRKDPSVMAKQVEMNWAIDENDLGYRLKKLKEFLLEGRRVEVMIAPKKKGRRAESDEIMNVLARIREAVDEVPGVTEWKAAEGVPGRIMELFYKGKEEKQTQQELLQEKDDKIRKKEAVKLERQQKQEARLKRKQEQIAKVEEEKSRLGIAQ